MAWLQRIKDAGQGFGPKKISSFVKGDVRFYGRHPRCPVGLRARHLDQDPAGKRLLRVFRLITTLLMLVVFSLTLRPGDHPEYLTAYLVGDVEVGLLGKRVDQQEHGVDPEAEGEEGDDLGAGSVEGDADESGETHAGGNSDGNKDDSGESETCLGSNLVGPAVEADHAVQHHEHIPDGDVWDVQLGEGVHDVLKAKGRIGMEVKLFASLTVSVYRLLKVLLELSKDLLRPVVAPVDGVGLVGVGPVVVEVPRAHQLHHALQPACHLDVARLVLQTAADNQLLGPVHVASGKAVAAACQLRPNLWLKSGGLVWGRVWALGVVRVQARLLLVARGDACSLHEVPKDSEGEGWPDLAHFLEELHRMQ